MLAQSLEQKIVELASDWTDERLLGQIAYNNSVMFMGCKNFGVAAHVGGRWRFIDRLVQWLPKLLGFPCAGTWVEGQIRGNWPSATCSENKVREARAVGAKLGFYSFSELPPPGKKGEKGTKDITRYFDFDLVGMSEFTAKLEQIYLAREGCSFETLPHHKGAFNKAIYDGLHPTAIAMNRKAPNGSTEMATSAEAEAERAHALVKLSGTRKAKLDQIRQTLREWRSLGFDKLESFKAAIAQLLAEKSALERALEGAIAELPF